MPDRSACLQMLVSCAHSLQRETRVTISRTCERTSIRWYKACFSRPVNQGPSMSFVKRSSAGFTLIELMIVVAIIAILAAIAIPQYNSYIIRAQASEGLSTAAGAKSAVWEFMHNKGHFPQSNESAGLPSGSSIGGKYVSSVDLQPSGVIQIAYDRNDSNAILRAATLTLSPIDNVGSIGWSCKSTLANQYLPSACRTN